MSLRFNTSKSIAIFVIVAFISISLRVDPLGAAVYGEIHVADQNEIATAGNFKNLYKDTENLFKKIVTDLVDEKDVFLRFNQLKQNKTNLDSLAGKIIVGFNKTRGDHLSKKVPDKSILQHDKIVKQCRNDLKSILKNLNQIEKTNRSVLKKEVKATKKHLKKNVFKKEHNPFDPKKLPHPRSILKP